MVKRFHSHLVFLLASGCMFAKIIQIHTIMNTRLEELKSKPLALLTVEEFLELQQGQKQEPTRQTYISDIIGIEETVILTGYKKSTLYRKTSTNTIPFHKRSNKVVFKRSELEAWMLENRQETVDEKVKRIDQQFLSKKSKA